MEFAEGNFGMIQGALDFHNDDDGARDDDRVLGRQTGQEPINYRFNWVNEPSVIYYTSDGSTPVKVDCDAPAGVSRCYNNQGPRRPGEVLQITALGVHDVKWFSEDIKGNRSAVKSQRFLIAADQENGGVSGNGAADAGAEPRQPGVVRRVHAGRRPRDYTASTTANVISTAGDGERCRCPTRARRPRAGS